MLRERQRAEGGDGGERRQQDRARRRVDGARDRAARLLARAQHIVDAACDAEAGSWVLTSDNSTVLHHVTTPRVTACVKSSEERRVGQECVRACRSWW